MPPPHPPTILDDRPSGLNRLLDTLPRTRVFRGARERPAFRSLGVAGYHAALIATLGAGLIARVSLLVLAAIAATCAISFFAWAHLRRAITGREEFVLLEHVWVAELASAAALYLMREPILPYLDAVSVGLAVFLAFGRAGCLLAGCCHGHPASIGIRYADDAARDGFPTHLVGVRLFPVQAVEALGLAGIALVGVALIGADEGRALAWFLAAYAVLRFGLEGLRGDDRPHLLGLSQARWMALVELAVALAIRERAVAFTPGRAAAALLLLVTLLVSLRLARRLDPRPRLLARAHLAELRAAVRAAATRAEVGGGSPIPEVTRTARWVSAAVSLPADGRSAHVSIALPMSRGDLRLLCDAAAGALPELDVASGHTAPPTLLHIRVPHPFAEELPPAAPGVADALYGAALRRLQHAENVESQEAAPPAAIASPAAIAPPAEPPRAATVPPANGSASPWDRRVPVEIEAELRRVWQRAPAALDPDAPPPAAELK